MITFMTSSTLPNVSYRIVQTFSEAELGYTNQAWLRLSKREQQLIVEKWEKAVLTQSHAQWYDSCNPLTMGACDWE